MMIAVAATTRQTMQGSLAAAHKPTVGLRLFN